MPPPPAQQIAAALAARAWTAQDLAEITGYSAKTISLVMNERQAITPLFAACIEKALGLSALDMLFWQNRQALYGEGGLLQTS